MFLSVSVGFTLPKGLIRISWKLYKKIDGHANPQTPSEGFNSD
ncbi:hypothetical protein PL11201_530132 [Planktothrix sp. PCC 11201]|nr:hypothetical protein PL11201_530132 [Planktothrix sp. PCC 11201]